MDKFLEIVSNILNSNFVTTVLGVVVGGVITISVNNKMVRSDKKRQIVDSLHENIISICDEIREDIIQYGASVCIEKKTKKRYKIANNFSIELLKKVMNIEKVTRKYEFSEFELCAKIDSECSQIRKIRTEMIIKISEEECKAEYVQTKMKEMCSHVINIRMELEERIQDEYNMEI